jgi:hypothetical protein
VKTYDETQNYQIAFLNAYYYRPFLLMIQPAAISGDTMKFTLWDFWTVTEYATAQEAEEGMNTGLNDPYGETWYHGYPLCGLIVRNNGNTGIPGAIQAIDRVNRGRSYTWPADCRPIDYSGV